VCEACEERDTLDDRVPGVSRVTCVGVSHYHPSTQMDGELQSAEGSGSGSGSDGGSKEGGAVGFKLAQAPGPKVMDRSPQQLQLQEKGAGGSGNDAEASTPVPTGGGQPEQDASTAAAEAEAEAQAEARKFVHRVRSILLEMHGVGMPDQKALAFVGRACELHRAGPESRHALVKLTQRIWRIAAAPPQQQQILRPLPSASDAGVGASNSAAAAVASLARRHVSFKGIGSDDAVSSKDGGEVVSPVVSSLSQQQPQQQSGRATSPHYARSTSPIAQLMGYAAGGGSSSSSSGPGETTTHKGPVLCLDVDPQGSLGVSGGADKLLVVYSILQRCRITTYSGHTAPVTCARILRDKGGEPLVASASLDSTLRIWKLGTGPVSVSSHPAAPALPPLLASFTTARDVRGVLTGHARGIVSMDASEELQLLATGAMDRVIKLWNVTQGRNTATLVGHTGTVASVKLLEQAQAYRLLSGGSDRTMALWDTGRGTCLRVFRGHESWVRHVESWGRDLAVTASNDRSLRLWDLRVHNCVQKLSEHQGAVTCLQVSEEQDAPLLFSGSTDATVRVWDLRAGGRCTAVLEGHSEAVMALALQQAPGGGRKLVSGGEDKRLVEWDARSGALLQSRMGHRDGISCLQVTQRNTVITGSFDCSVRIWEGCGMAP
jgi:WD40 repeat protein